MNKVIIFTSRLIGEEKTEYLFSPDNSVLYKVENNSALYKFHQTHSKYTKDIDKIRRQLLQKVGGGINGIKSEIQAYLKVGHQKVSFNLIINKKSVNKTEVLAFINKTFIESNKKNLTNIKIDKLEDLVNLDLQPSNLNSRINIFKIKNTNIFGYRCLDLWDDYVDDREGFISALVTDVAKILKKSSLKDFFQSFELDLVLHGEDINFASGALGQDIENKQLLIFNDELKNDKEKINTYVYSHVYGNFFMKILVNYSKLSDSDLNEKIENYFKNRKKFEELEKGLLLAEKTEVTELSKILNNNFQNEKIY